MFQFWKCSEDIPRLPVSWFRMFVLLLFLGLEPPNMDPRIIAGNESFDAIPVDSFLSTGWLPTQFNIWLYYGKIYGYWSTNITMENHHLSYIFYQPVLYKLLYSPH